MKRIIALLLALSGGVVYNTCGKDELKGNDKYRVVYVKRFGNSGEVRFRRYRDEKTVVYECLPDSIEKGKLMDLPAFE